MSNKVIISCAVTGSAHTPTMSDALPVTPEEIAEQSIAAAKREQRSSISTRACRKTDGRQVTRMSSLASCR